ncbi:hypothetical protein COEREDRAFT_99797 [Coemansia reversa NRRL 1564]|uniref:Uncharacterized protein n=1 Tax=Coemansia reversa (strain ATCC 12441 / NRRL 1564) TaxID=763665 RepID=A0A2G5B236_COERN|nr:hypothetical protein COEREDRAFT_99797 [Coemansia reversa NRRL 1564]|eukprot:PIA13064.1 hypothetical protein COEREDRAFT_99797 [Coemansia reversa NRRL 1564]
MACDQARMETRFALDNLSRRLESATNSLKSCHQLHRSDARNCAQQTRGERQNNKSHLFRRFSNRFKRQSAEQQQQQQQKSVSTAPTELEASVENTSSPESVVVPTDDDCAMPLDDAVSHLNTDMSTGNDLAPTAGIIPEPCTAVGANYVNRFAVRATHRRLYNRRESFRCLSNRSKRQSGGSIPGPIVKDSQESGTVVGANRVNEFAAQVARQRQHERTRWVAELSDRRSCVASSRLGTKWMVQRVVLVRTSCDEGMYDAQHIDSPPATTSDTNERTDAPPLPHGLELEDTLPCCATDADTHSEICVDVGYRSSIEASKVCSNATFESFSRLEYEKMAAEPDDVLENEYLNVGSEDDLEFADVAIGSDDGLDYADLTGDLNDSLMYEGSKSKSDSSLECAHPMYTPDSYLEYESSRAESDDSLEYTYQIYAPDEFPEYEYAVAESDYGPVPGFVASKSTSSLKCGIASSSSFENSVYIANLAASFYSSVDEDVVSKSEGESFVNDYPWVDEASRAGAESEPEIAVVEASNNTNSTGAAVELADNSESEDLDQDFFNQFMDTLHEESEELEGITAEVNKSATLSEAERDAILVELQRCKSELLKRHLKMMKSPKAFVHAINKRVRLLALADVHYKENLVYSALGTLRICATAHNIKFENTDVI